MYNLHRNRLKNLFKRKCIQNVDLALTMEFGNLCYRSPSASSATYYARRLKTSPNLNLNDSCKIAYIMSSDVIAIQNLFPRVLYSSKYRMIYPLFFTSFSYFYHSPSPHYAYVCEATPPRQFKSHYLSIDLA